MRQFSQYLMVLASVLGLSLALVPGEAFAQRGGGRNKPVQQTPEDINPVLMELLRAAPGTFDPETMIEIQVTVTASTTEGVTAIGLRETPPGGWMYGDIRAISNELPAIAKQDEASGVIEFAWITPPIMPVTFAYTLQVPPAGPETSGMQFISGQVEYRTLGGRLVSPPVVTPLQGEDVVPPEINLLGANPVYLEEGESYSEPGFTATDDVDGDLTGQVQVSGNVDTSKPGTYQQTYTVKDKAGNETIKTRVVQVRKKPEEEPPPVAANPVDNNDRNNNQNNRNNRSRGSGAVATAFENFNEDFDADGNPINTNTPQNQDNMANAAEGNPVKHPNDTGQPSNPHSLTPKTTFTIPTAVVSSSPNEFDAQGNSLNAKPVAPNLAALAKAAAGNNPDTKPATDGSSSEPVAAAKKAGKDISTEGSETMLAANTVDAAKPAVPDSVSTVATVATPAISAPTMPPSPGIIERISDNLGKLTKQDLIGLGGLAVVFLVLSSVAFIFWRGAYRPSMRR